MRKRRERQKVEGDQKARVDLSVTDQAFDAAKPGYFIFREKSEERKCWNCSDTFETKLELNKFCSPKCKEEFLRDSLNANRKEKP
jgi:protein-arginine kinase activator protein McsA